MNIRPSENALGARITGLDLTVPPEPRTASAIREALWTHLVLHFPAQDLTERQQLDFTSLFSEPLVHVRSQPGAHEPGIFIVSNVVEDGAPIGALGAAHIGFHSDLAYLPEPGTVSTLYAVEVPDQGGDTTWASGYSAYEALGSSTREKLRGIRAVHQHTTPELNPAEPTQHPVVITHPESGRKALFVTPLFTRELVGLPADEDKNKLLRRLVMHATQPRFTWTHHWQPGDLVVWDNRATQHSRAAFDSDARRVMRRTQIFNDTRPVP